MHQVEQFFNAKYLVPSISMKAQAGHVSLQEKERHKCYSLGTAEYLRAGPARTYTTNIL
jgi:hypothetical protein